MTQQHVVCNKEADIAVIKSDVASIKGDIYVIRKSLLGNGVPGLTTRTAKVEQAISIVAWIGGAMFTAVLGGVVTIAIKVFGGHS